MQSTPELDMNTLVAQALMAARAFAKAYNIELLTPSESEVAATLRKILFEPKDVLEALKMRIITLTEARNRILFEFELWLRTRQEVPRSPQVGDWVPSEVSATIDESLSEWLQKNRG